MLMSMENVRSTSSADRDPFDPRRYETLFDAQLILSGGKVLLLKSAAAGEVAPAEKPPSGQRPSSTVALSTTSLPRRGRR